MGGSKETGGKQDARAPLRAGQTFVCSSYTAITRDNWHQTCAGAEGSAHVKRRAQKGSWRLLERSRLTIDWKVSIAEDSQKGTLLP